MIFRRLCDFVARRIAARIELPEMSEIETPRRLARRAVMRSRMRGAVSLTSSVKRLFTDAARDAVIPRPVRTRERTPTFVRRKSMSAVVSAGTNLLEGGVVVGRDQAVALRRRVQRIINTIKAGEVVL